MSDSGRLIYASCPSRLISTLTYLSNACDCSNIHTIWLRIGGDTRGEKLRGNGDISQEWLLISGRTKRQWKALFIMVLLTPSSSDFACSFWRSMLSCNLLLLPFSVSDSGRLVYVCCPSRLIRTSTYSLNACDRSNIHAIWPRIGGDTRGAKSRGNRTISQEGLIICNGKPYLLAF